MFKTQDERKKYGKSDFIELSFCKLPDGATEDTLMDNVHFWREDSLYAGSDSDFYKVNNNIFVYGLNSDGKEGTFDYYGMTYYKPEKIDDIIKRASEVKPDGYEVLISWLKKAKSYNGFYILGM